MAQSSNESKLSKKVAKLLAPPPKLTVSQWADAERRLPQEAAAEPGRWNTDRAPFQRGIMDARDEDGVNSIVIMSSAQVGKTELLLNLIGFHIALDPSPILLVQPTLELAEAFSKDRLATMIRDTPALSAKVKDPRSRDSGNTLLQKAFPGGHITMAGSNSPASLASRPIRIVLCDEVDRYPPSAGAEGDPVKLAQARADTFMSNKFFVICSTPTIEGASRIQKAYEDSDQRRFHVPCPLCNAMQILQFPSLKWDKDEAGRPINVRHGCSSCGKDFDDSQKDWMLLNGKWVAQAPFKGVAGFHLSALYSPWRNWADLAAEFIEATKAGNEALKVFVNTKLGETWKEKGEAPEWKRIYERREKYAISSVPGPVIFLTAGVDVQKDRLEWEVVGWCRDRQSFSIEHRVVLGDTASEEPWKELDRLLMHEWTKADGQMLRVRMLAVDSGFNTQHVYNWARRYSPTRVMAVKGSDTAAVPLGQPSAVDLTLKGRRVRRGFKVWPVGVSILKAELYSWLKLDRPSEGEEYPAGYCHFPEYAEEYFEQLTAEVLVTRVVKGFRRYEWVKTRERNEALDMRIYASAAAIACGRDRMTPEQWDHLLGEHVPAPSQPGREQTPQDQPPRRKRESSFW